MAGSSASLGGLMGGDVAGYCASLGALSGGDVAGSWMLGGVVGRSRWGWRRRRAHPG